MTPIRVDIEQRQQQIIEAAMGIFAQRGYADTRMIDVAQAAGLGKGTLYQYFPSKQALFLGVFDTFMAQLMEMSRAGAAAPTFREQVMTIVEASFKAGCADEIRAMLPLTFEFWSASARGEIPEIYAHFKAGYSEFTQIIAVFYRAAVERGEIEDSVDPERFAAALVGLLDGLSLQLWFREDMDVYEAAKCGVDTLLRGLEKKEEAR